MAYKIEFELTPLQCEAFAEFFKEHETFSGKIVLEAETEEAPATMQSLIEQEGE